jgi:hypothetical protein
MNHDVSARFHWLKKDSIQSGLTIDDHCGPTSRNAQIGSTVGQHHVGKICNVFYSKKYKRRADLLEYKVDTVRFLLFFSRLKQNMPSKNQLSNCQWNKDCLPRCTHMNRDCVYSVYSRYSYKTIEDHNNIQEKWKVNAVCGYVVW